MKQYSEYLKSQSVALVGPAPTMEGSQNGAFIESFDIVVRLNHILPIPKQLQNDIGERTDVLYHNLWESNPYCTPFPRLVEILEETVQWICSAHPEINLDHPFAEDIASFKKTLSGRVPFHLVDQNRYLKLREAIGCRPNVGISAIVDLLSFEISELYITGFTFYRQDLPQYHKHYHAMGLDTVHNQEKQRMYLQELVSKDSRINFDYTF